MILLFFCNTTLAMVEVFKTDVTSETEADMLLAVLQKKYPEARINFDLQDCDRILRIKGTVSTKDVVDILISKGYFCEELN